MAITVTDLVSVSGLEDETDFHTGYIAFTLKSTETSERFDEQSGINFNSDEVFDGFVADQSEPFGWNNYGREEAKTAQNTVGSLLVRQNITTLHVYFGALLFPGYFGSYDISVNEEWSITLPGEIFNQFGDGLPHVVSGPVPNVKIIPDTGDTPAASPNVVCTAELRANASNVMQVWFGPGVTPSAAKGATWRAESGYSFTPTVCGAGGGGVIPWYIPYRRRRR